MPRLARLAFCFVTCLLTSASFAQQPTASSVPNLIRYSGTLKDVQAKTASSAPVGVTFAIYKQQDGGAPIWQETQNVTPDANGQYTVLLGSTTAAGLPDDLFSQQEQRWLGIQLQGEAEQPRVLMVSVPYAFKAHEAETLGGLPASAFVKTPSTDGSGSASNDASGSTSEIAGAPGRTGKPGKSGSGIDTVINCVNAANNYIPVFTAVRPPNITICNSVMYQLNSNIGIGTTTPLNKLDVNDNNNSAVIAGTTTNSAEFGVVGQNLATSGSGVATFGHTKGPTGIGVFGIHDSLMGGGMGVSGITESSSGVGVLGTANTPTGMAAGVSGASASVDGIGVAGLVVSRGMQGHMSVGVRGTAQDPNGYGGFFANLAVTGPAIGVSGASDSSTGKGVYGVGDGPSNTGQMFGNPILVGVWGDSAYGVGVLATADDSTAIIAINNSSTGATIGGGNQSTSGSAAIGVEGGTASTSGAGVFGQATATTGTTYGVEGQSASPSGYGVYGVNTSGGGYGVYGVSTSGYGVYGSASTGVGIQGTCAPTGSNTCFNGIAGLNLTTSGNANGLWGLTQSPQGNAVYLVNSGGGNLIYGTPSNGGSATFTVTGNGGGFFGGSVQINGNLNVTGTLSKGMGSFKIDHPLDPANKYLSHSFVESPDMMNMYNGNVTTDKRGLATVVLPGYFEALNRDFRYQLTVIGQFAQAIIAKEIHGGRFTIRTNRPGVKVSWQVTGIRQDALANAHRIPVEEDKPQDQRGTYLHPELYGADKSTDATLRH